MTYDGDIHISGTIGMLHCVTILPLIFAEPVLYAAKEDETQPSPSSSTSLYNVCMRFLG